MDYSSSTGNNTRRHHWVKHYEPITHPSQLEVSCPAQFPARKEEGRKDTFPFWGRFSITPLRNVDSTHWEAAFPETISFLKAVLPGAPCNNGFPAQLRLTTATTLVFLVVDRQVGKMNVFGSPPTLLSCKTITLGGGHYISNIWIFTH